MRALAVRRAPLLRRMYVPVRFAHTPAKSDADIVIVGGGVVGLAMLGGLGTLHD